MRIRPPGECSGACRIGDVKHGSEDHVAFTFLEGLEWAPLM